MSPRSTDSLKACPTVLVIDDDPAVRCSLEILLEEYGFQVVAACDGRQGLAAFRTVVPDIVLTDIMMPVQDGIETIAQIRRERPNAPIVAMSGGARFGDADYLAIALKLGANDAIEKPFEVDSLVAILRAATPSASPHAAVA